MLRYQGFEVEKNYDFTLGCLAYENLQGGQAKLAGGNSMLRYQGFEVEKNPLCLWWGVYWREVDLWTRTIILMKRRYSAISKAA